MTLETFFEKFDQFADAPDAVVSSRICVITFHLAPLAPASAGVMNLVRISASVRAFLFMLLRSSAAAASQSLASKPRLALPLDADLALFDLAIVSSYQRK